jgi:hypothetical protein
MGREKFDSDYERSNEYQDSVLYFEERREQEADDCADCMHNFAFDCRDCEKKSGCLTNSSRWEYRGDKDE